MKCTLCSQYHGTLYANDLDDIINAYNKWMDAENGDGYLDYSAKMLLLNNSQKIIHYLVLAKAGKVAEEKPRDYFSYGYGS